MPQRNRSTLPSAGARPRGHALAEALCSLVLLGIGLLPLADLAATGIGWLREYHALAHATRVGGELAELDAVGAGAGRSRP